MRSRTPSSVDGDRLIALSRLLPNISGSVTESRRKINLEAFGFPLGPNFPRVVGPFNVFDARVFLSQTVYDAEAFNEKSAASHRLEAARHTYRGARSIVMLASANLYLEALAAQARSDSGGGATGVVAGDSPAGDRPQAGRHHRRPRRGSRRGARQLRSAAGHGRGQRRAEGKAPTGAPDRFADRPGIQLSTTTSRRSRKPN